MDRFRPTLGDCVLAVVMFAGVYVFVVLALTIGTIATGG